ncbi:MAG: hypothetical protein ACI86M_003506 [Saprospiraceae bacterium]|jgi:hypothetical protein
MSRRNANYSFFQFYLVICIVFGSSTISIAQCPINDPAFNIITGGIEPYTLHNVAEAWECTCGDEEVEVAVIDIFSPQFHEDLQGKLVEIYSDPILSSQFLECGHGNSTSGIIAAVPNNNIAVVGIGYNTRIGIFNIAGGCDGDSSQVFGAFQAAVDGGYRIINSTLIFDLDGEEQEKVLSDFLANGGLLVVAGGYNRHAVYADWPGVINVGGMISGEADGEYIYENVSGVEEVVPLDIFVSTENMEGLMAFDQWGILEARLSQSAAMVSGAAALMLAANDTLTGAEIEQIIKETGQGVVLNAPENSVKSYLDIGAAVKGAAAFGIVDNTNDLEQLLLPLYPNPTSGFIYLDSEYDQVTAVSVSGNERLLLVENGRIDASDLPNGVYYIKTRDNRVGRFLKV